MPRFQFRLRTILILTTIIAVWIGWWSYKARQQREVVRVVTRLGGFVTYDFMVDQSGQLVANAPPTIPTWLDVDYFSNVVRVNLDGTDVTDADLEHLKCLAEMRWLNLFNTKITDAGLENLKGLSKLERLELGSAAYVTDAGLEHLKGLTQLRGVYLGGTQISDQGEARLRRSLPSLR
ncbi:MAG: hypothetical protein K8T91_06195 [Planctomycetes bacterium]|nr:hypothetical protein [Planctomycetota bacterium]